MLGFETIGNAILILYDGGPVLATDPWIDGDAYFGSWGHSHEIPAEQRSAIKACRRLWLSHAHPDHTNVNSLTDLAPAELLLANHYGARLQRDLTAMGFKVTVLPERKWVSVSPRIKILTLADMNQDSILLVDLDGVLIINLNDAGDCGWGYFVRKIAKNFKQVFLMRLWGEAAADMTNVFSEDGKLLITSSLVDHSKLGRAIQADARRYHATHAVPFSSFHRFQREDSIWANEILSPFGSFQNGADPSGPAILKPFTRFNRTTGEVTTIEAKENASIVRTALECGDNWNDPLTAEDEANLRQYFQSKELLRHYLAYIRFRVGGREMSIDIAPRTKLPGVTFEAPRQSLVAAVQYRIFDDMMIANFMRTTLDGNTERTYLNKTFTPVVCKYADNANAQSKKEFQRYVEAYRSRDRLGSIFLKLETHSESIFRKFVKHDSIIHKSAKRLYWTMKA